ncbi:MAG: LysR family transcriptional regulator [Desulfuromonadales bacterium]|nr:LysR family transcriptional regulator [Desulfuromonadales bacterium]
MDVRQLRFFLQVCKDLNITQAAEKLHITQQGLSTSLVRLEDEIGCTLFLRTSKCISLSNDGIYFRSQAEKIISIVDESLIYFKNKNSQKTELLIGCAYGVVGEFANKLFDSTAKINQLISLKIKEYPDILCETAIVSNEIEVGLSLGPIDKRQFESFFLFERKLCFIAHKNHPLAQFDIIGIEQLANEKIIIMNKDFKVYHTLRALCKNKGIEPFFAYETGDIAMIHNLVSKNYGIGISTDFLAKDMNLHDIKVINVKDPAFVWTVYLVTKKHQRLSNEAEIFKNYLLESLPYN